MGKVYQAAQDLGRCRKAPREREGTVGDTTGFDDIRYEVPGIGLLVLLLLFKVMASMQVNVQYAMGAH